MKNSCVIFLIFSIHMYHNYLQIKTQIIIFCLNNLHSKMTSVDSVSFNAWFSRNESLELSEVLLY